MTVRRLLKGKGRFVSVAPPTCRVQDIVDQLERDDVAAVVVSADGKKIEGIVSARSIARGLKTFGSDVVHRPVCDLLTHEVVTCDVNEPLSKIYELMDEHQIRHVPITDNGSLCGIINTLDVVKYRLEEIKAEAEAMKDYIAGRA
ncbi:MAG: CBS domain-containing protein [Alphaproteobacteria bacterium]